MLYSIILIRNWQLGLYLSCGCKEKLLDTLSFANLTQDKDKPLKKDHTRPGA